MRPDEHGSRGHSKKGRRPHGRRQDSRGATGSQVPRAWTNKTMHHPATRIGEMKHGKQ